MELFYETPDGRAKLYLGDAIEIMAEFPDACVDAIVTDPPYGLEFMGKEWDSPHKLSGKPTRPMNVDIDYPGTGLKTLPNFHRVNNVRCAKCNKWRFSGTPCVCDESDFPNVALSNMQAYQSWTTAWATEAYRILKPGAYMLVMGGTRTHHRLACGLEDAGFEIRDELAWIYASGFPKNYDVSRGIDKKAGAEREKVGKSLDSSNRKATTFHGAEYKQGWTTKAEGERHITKAATPEAQYWSGFGTALKPAHEPVWLCKKPNEGTYVDNVLKHGCGAMNIDGSRVEYQKDQGPNSRRTFEGDIRSKTDYQMASTPHHQRIDYEPPPSGRWPANVIVDCYPEEFIGGAVLPEKEIRLHGPPKEGLRGPEMRWERTEESEGDRELWVFVEEYFDDEDVDEEGCMVYPYTQFVWCRRGQGGVVIEGEAQLHHGGPIRAKTSIGDGNIYQGGGPGLRKEPDEDDKGDGLLGSYTRFFVIPKPSKAEKNRGCMGLYWRREKDRSHTQIDRKEWEALVAEEKRIYEETGKRVRLQARGNIHVTVKPVRLMKWLIKLITPHQHPVVLIDPFCGSGTSLVAVLELNREEEYQIDTHGVDKEPNNTIIAKARLEAEGRYLL